MSLNLRGGVFTQDVDEKRFVLWRDKDMPAVLTRRTDAIGFLGSDTFDELNEELRGRLEYSPVITTDIRFALCALEQEVERVRQRIRKGDEITVATSYAQRTKEVANRLGFQLSEIIELGGSVEAAPYIFDQVDAIIDVVDTGETLKENGLSIVADNLARLSIGAVWNKSSEAEL